MRLGFVALLCCALVFALLPTVDAQPTHLWTYEKYGGYIRLPTFSMPNAQVTYENTTEGFEFNITLSKKPAGSSFKVNIESGGWDWYYQPPLDQELNVSQYTFVNATHALNGTEVLVHRPENVVGSYAVYANSNYSGTGKVFHLYRPLLIDKNGARSWGNVNVTGGVLTVSGDASWLNNAVYPVVVDPTFGYTDKGGTGSTPEAGRTYTTVATLGEAGDITKMTLYYTTSTNAKAYVGIYDDSGAAPNNLLGQSAEETFTHVFDNWRDFTITEAGLAAANYWLAFMFDTTAGSIYYDATGTTKYKNGAYPTMPDPFGTPTGTVTRKYSIYATYDVSDGDSYALALTVASPENVTYDETIPVSLSTSGNATNIVYNWNVQFSNSSWLYAVNKTSSTYTMEIYENQTNCLFACVVTGDVDVSDYEEVYFSVVYIPSDAWDTDLNNYFCAAMLLVMGFVFMVFMVSRRRY